MAEIVLKDKSEYNLDTAEGRQNILDYMNEYNKNIDNSDPLNKTLDFDAAFAICNVEGFIKSKSSIVEVVREALEIAFTCKNFKSNTIYTFTRQKLKKMGYNSIVRMQIENYIQFRMNQTDKKIKNTNFENVATFTLNGETFYYNVLNGEELAGEKLEAYKEYQKQQLEAEALPF